MCLRSPHSLTKFLSPFGRTIISWGPHNIYSAILCVALNPQSGNSSGTTLGVRSVALLHPRSYGRKLQPIPPFLPQKALFLRKNAFFCKKIWSCAIFVVPLHPLSNESDVLKHFAAIAQLVEHNLAKVGVASSSLVCRSIEMSRT